MLTLKATSQFRKDYKLAKKRGLDTSRLDEVIEKLLHETLLENHYCDHALTGKYRSFRECHIAPDWLLVYATNNKTLVLTVARTGSHSDLFGK
jgi:mRNA interferase YafQ